MMVAYAAPSGPGVKSLRDLGHNDVATFSVRSVTNETPAPANAAPTGLPTIFGTALVGQTLTASAAAIVNAQEFCKWLACMCDSRWGPVTVLSSHGWPPYR